MTKMQTALSVVLVLSLAVAATGFTIKSQKVDEQRLLQPVPPIHLGDELEGAFSGTDPQPFRPPEERGFWLAAGIGWVTCKVLRCRRRRQLSEESAQDQLENSIASFIAKSKADFRSLYNEKVIKAALYTVPSSVLGKDITEDEELLDGVLVTLSNGRRLMITRGPELWGDEQSAILEVEDLTEKWVFVESKSVQISVVADYVSASDSSSTSKEAAERMMALA